MFSKKTASAVFLSFGLTFAAGGMAIAEPANTVGCLHMSRQVSDALDAHQQSDNLKAAQDQQSIARQSCMSGRYSDGLSHYAKALQLLGVTNG